VFYCVNCHTGSSEYLGTHAKCPFCGEIWHEKVKREPHAVKKYQNVFDNIHDEFYSSKAPKGEWAVVLAEVDEEEEEDFWSLVDHLMSK
jgi:hypothetical protein